MNISKTQLRKKLDSARELVSPCRLCPRKCGAERARGKTGYCKAGAAAKIYSYRQYLGEEPPISGNKGSGVIFFSDCTMNCVYCQNFRFSQNGSGYIVDPKRLSKIMSSLKKRGCHNINLVTASHYLPYILEALLLSSEELSSTPIVYNTSGYESKEVLDILDGIVDVYLANMRYCNNSLSWVYSNTKDYADINKEALSTMRRQVGELVVDNKGLAKKGLIIRHLVMPNLLENTKEILRYISENISKESHISLMAQYLPLHKAKEFPELSRPITPEEYKEAWGLLERYGLTNGWVQGF